MAVSFLHFCHFSILVTVSFIRCLESELPVEGGYSPPHPKVYAGGMKILVSPPVFLWEFSLRLKQILLLIPYGEEKCCY